MKLGVLDLGSNTTKLLVAEAKSEDSFEVLLEKSSAARMNLFGSKKRQISSFSRINRCSQ